MKSLLLFLSFFITLSCWAKFEVPGFELVYTAPVETSLQTDDLRNPAEVWCELFDGAKKRIDLGQMYASSKPGEPLEKVIACLEKAGERGVKIRMLLEQKMLRASYPETVEQLKKIKGLELRVLEFNKLKVDGIIHAKYMVIDNKSAYVGSQNFDWRSLNHIHETGLRITNPVIVRQVQAIFEHDWKAWSLVQKGKKVPGFTHKSYMPKPTDRAFLLASPQAHNPKGVAYSEEILPLLLAEAKDEIRIILLDYYPLNRDKSFYPIIDNALRAAQARGVKIKLLVSHWNTSKPGIDHLKSLAMLPGVEIKVNTIPQAKEGKIPFARVTHSKVMSIDNKIAWVGTSNWTGGYMNNSRDLEIVVRDEALANRLTALHEQAWSSGYSEKLDITKDYPKVDKGGE